MELVDTFVDKKDRKIEIKVDEDENWCLAFHQGNKIGKFEYDLIEEELNYACFQYVYICHMNVIQGYRHCGTGKKIMQALADFYSTHVTLPQPKEIAGDATYYLIEDGPRFKQSCIDADLIANDN